MRSEWSEINKPSNVPEMRMYTRSDKGRCARVVVPAAESVSYLASPRSTSRAWTQHPSYQLAHGAKEHLAEQPFKR